MAIDVATAGSQVAAIARPARPCSGAVCRALASSDRSLRERCGAFVQNHLALLVLGGLTLGPALDWPEGWDELVYHAQLPQRWLRDGGMAVYGDLPYSGFPSLGEAVAWFVAPIEHVIAPRLILWCT